jgi:hypothetical protein
MTSYHEELLARARAADVPPALKESRGISG